MSIKCEECQFEQKSIGDKCENCQAPLNHKEKFVICSECGLSNDGLAKTCIGCNAKLMHTSKVEFEKEMPLDEDLDTKSLFFNKYLSKFKKIPKKHLIAGVASIAAIFSLIVVLMIVLNNDSYIHPEEGFYYISNNNELFIVDDKQEKILLLSGVENVESVKKFKKNIYFLADEKLYEYKKKKAVLLAEDVHSFKVNLKGDRLLYTVFLPETGYGDLYLFDGDDHLRIDGNVGHDRYIFSNEKNGVFYVKDITDEESLGTLYFKINDEPAKEVADDVFEPLVSLKNETVYFVRKDIDAVAKFELYYNNGKQIIEIDRHVKHMILSADEEIIYLIQEKNDIISLLSTEDGEVKTLHSDIKGFGQYRYGDIEEAFVYLDPFFFLYNETTQTHYYVDAKGSETIDITMNDYLISEDQKMIFALSDEDIDVYEFKKGKIKDKYNVGSQAELIAISPEGKYAVIKKHTGEVVLSDKGNEIKSPDDASNFSFSNNEKYVMYQSKNDVSVHKITAKEPVFLSESPEAFFMIDDEVYYFENNKVFRYKLGRFKSKTEIDTYKMWSYLD